MQREDLPTLRALGFTDDELKALGLWEAPIGDPATLADAYIRRSKKRDTLTTLRAHLRDICRAAERDGIAIRHVWFEQRSASKAHVKREEFDNATGAILDGKSRTLYVWKTDRLSRRGMGQVGMLLDEFERRRSRVVSVTEGIDSVSGRMIFALLAERARDEARDIAMRTKTGGDANKFDGRWPGGVVPFGLECPKGSGKLRHAAREYPTARRIALLLLDGVVPAAIANTLNGEGVRTRKGKNWRAQTIIHLAKSPSWAGLIPDRERATDEYGNPLDKWHRGGTPLMGPDGHPIRAGEGVVSFAEWTRINAIIAGRSRPGTSIGDRRRGKRKAVTLMTGLLRCPHCKGAAGNGGRNYRCLARINQGKAVCKGFATQRARVDDAMESAWLGHMLSLTPESPTLHAIARRWLSYQDPAKEARKAAVSAALDNAASRETRLQKEFFIGGRMDETTFEALRAELGQQIASLKAELAELSRGADLSPLMNAEALTALWTAEGVEGRRALLAAALESVTLIAAKCVGDQTPITERLVPKWRDDTTHDDAVFDAALRAVERSAQRKAGAGA